VVRRFGAAMAETLVKLGAGTLAIR
jgi:hypothetical protein